jgi:hypothetical protein
MPVVIRDFSVEANDQNEPEPAASPAAPEALPQPPTGREINQLMKALKCRAGRLHAD